MEIEYFGHYGGDVLHGMLGGQKFLEYVFFFFIEICTMTDPEKNVEGSQQLKTS